MSPRDEDKLNRVENLKSKLFSRNFEMRPGRNASFSPTPEKKVSESWQKEGEGLNVWERVFMRTPVFKKFFFFSVAFFVLAVGYASYIFFFKGNTVSNENIEIAVLGNTFTAGGEELSLVVEITNRNNVALDLVDLVIEYPKGTADGTVQNTERYRESLGTIPSGAVRSENVKLVLFGEQGSVSSIKIAIEYRVEGSNAIFLKERLYEVSIDSTPLSISFNAPAVVSPNQDITLDVKYALNATKPISNVLLRVDYPGGFQFASAKPAPSFGNNVWNLGDLAPGAEQTITINGEMLDVFEGEEKIFRVQSGSQSASDKSSIDVVFNSVAHVVMIEKPLIDARLFINGVHQREHATVAKGTITGEIRWSNNLETKINDFSIRAKVTGNALDRKEIDASRGFYNSLEDVIVWDRNSISDFREVDPGESGSVTFTLAPLPLFSATAGLMDKPQINIEVSVTGKQPLEASNLEDISNAESSVVKIISDVSLATKALYYSGAFPNTGPIPPQAEKETTYTIVWTLTNTSNPISRAKVTSSLPPWISFLKSSSPDTLTYNPSTKEIAWDVGTIARGAGITGAGKEVSFQVSLTPSLSQVGTTPVIVNDSILTGNDDFANVSVRVNKSSLNTRLSNDPVFPSFGDRVVE